MSRGVVVLGALCCLLVVGGTVLGGQAAHTADRQPSAAQPPAQGLADVDENFTSTEFVLRVYPNQSVRWTYVHKTPLGGDARREWFEAYTAEFENGTTGTFDSFRQRAANLAENGTRATGRQMTARSFDRDTRIEGLTDNLGVVSMSFLWTNLTRTESDGLVMDDVFSNGLYLGPNQTLVVERSDSLQFASVDPAPASMSATTLSDSVSVTWSGEREFNGFRPRTVLASPNGSTPGGPAVTTDAGPTTTAPGSSDSPAPSGSSLVETLALVVFAAVAVAALAVGVWLYHNGEFGGGSEKGAGGAAASTAASAPAAGSTTEESTAEESATEDGDAPVGGEQFLSDEERVMALLDEEGGRMKQSRIVEETDWSKSKVSMLLTDMEDDDDITKLRVGRENIISLPGNEPEAARSPFDDDE
jgi:hypothetical protein